MSRRTAALLALLAASLGGLIAWLATAGLPAQPYALLSRWRPQPVLYTARLEDPRSSLAIGRGAIEGEILRFERDLGIDLRVVVRAKAQPGAVTPERRAEELLEERDAGAGFPTGGLVVLVDVEPRRIAAAATEDVAAAIGDRFGPLVASRGEPLVGHRYAGIALASGLQRLADHLLERAHAGDLDVDQPGSILELVRAAERAAPRCAGVPEPAPEPSASVEALRCLLLGAAVPAGSPVVTEASRFQLARAPFGAFEARTRSAALQAGRPWKVSVDGDRAAVRPTAPVREFPPVLLLREGGRWRIDLVEMGKTFRRDPGGSWQRWSLRSPYWLVLGGMQAPQLQDLEPIELWGEPLADAIVRLEGTSSPAAKERLAEILLRNVWLPSEALARWDEALALAPDDLRAAKRFADRAEFLDQPLLAASTLEPFGAPVMERVAELMLRAGRIQEGLEGLQDAVSLRRLRRQRNEAGRDEADAPAAPAI